MKDVPNSGQRAQRGAQWISTSNLSWLLAGAPEEISPPFTSCACSAPGPGRSPRDQPARRVRWPPCLLPSHVRGEAVAPAHESCDVLALAREEAAAVREGDPPSHLTHGSGKMTNAAHKKSRIAAPFSGSVAAGPTRKPNISTGRSAPRWRCARLGFFGRRLVDLMLD
jgi:hypothetical protein